MKFENIRVRKLGAFVLPSSKKIKSAILTLCVKKNG